MFRNFIGTGCLLLAMASTLGAQEYRATLSGAVSDPQGAFVANAQVRVTSVETGVEYKTVSNNDGAYSIPFLAPGSYILRVQVTGFRPVSGGAWVHRAAGGRYRHKHLPDHGTAAVQISSVGFQLHQHADLWLSEHEPGITAVRAGPDYADELAAGGGAGVPVF